MRRNGARFGRRGSRQRAASAPITDPVAAAIDAIGGFEDWVSDSVSAGPVQTWTGRIQSLLLQQPTPANRPGYTATNANIGNAKTLDFVDATDILVSDLAASAWKWLHDGSTGVTMYLVYYHAATASTTVQGLGTRQSASAQNTAYVVPFGTAPNFTLGTDVGFTQAFANGTYAAGKRWLAGRSPIASPNRIVECRSSLSSSWVASGSAAPGTGNPGQTFGLGFGVATTFSVARAILFNKNLTDPQHASMAAAFDAKYGVF